MCALCDEYVLTGRTPEYYHAFTITVVVVVGNYSRSLFDDIRSQSYMTSNWVTVTMALAQYCCCCCPALKPCMRRLLGLRTPRNYRRQGYSLDGSQGVLLGSH